EKRQGRRRRHQPGELGCVRAQGFRPANVRGYGARPLGHHGAAERFHLAQLDQSYVAGAVEGRNLQVAVGEAHGRGAGLLHVLALHAATGHQLARYGSCSTMRWWVIWDYREALCSGLYLTVKISIFTMIGSLLLGTFVACLRQLPSFAIERAMTVYVELIRNIPSVVKVFFLYFVAGLDALPAAVLGLSLHQSSYIADVLDSGFRAIPREQSEAAWACGHDRRQIFVHVLLPQVCAITMPPLASQFI